MKFINWERKGNFKKGNFKCECFNDEHKVMYVRC